jgi:hypothetical protein
MHYFVIVSLLYCYSYFLAMDDSKSEGPEKAIKGVNVSQSKFLERTRHIS